ncbi:amino acid/amide ABC transporter membrane protein 2, HAAT family [Limimonas halophila]|uniref:Amino acid/amide ABC transporter membrane protein 2, HAAT family n=1 Tax=Limimonas halophila TaxID=1082479 RepID=A0A1G7QIM4_9PROT|nr:branched-chain amino acid ABC transporter permease [Limimonas halophila]SDF98315.1 amino acid/amide ABC transporter membrane protein 2, HAAT family [Limimonas halophila]
MALSADAPRCGEFRTTYRQDTRIFPTAMSRNFAVLGVILAAACPLVLTPYYLNLLIQIGYFGVAALGLNLLVGFSGQISLGHAAFFGFGAFTSAYLSTHTGIPVILCIPLAGLITTAVGMIVGIPAGRIKGLYLAIATLAAQFIIEDFFSRAEWFTGGSAGSFAEPVALFGMTFDTDRSYFYIVLGFVLVMFLLASNLVRSRDGRALIAVRDHYLSAEIMGINLTKYRILAFGISAFYAGVGGAIFAHYLGFVSIEGFTILMSIQFLGMIIIGGLGSIMGTLMGVAFLVLLPEVMEMLAAGLSGAMPGIEQGVAYMKEIAIGLAIVGFLIFEPEGLAHRWKLIKAYWKLYPFSY